MQDGFEQLVAEKNEQRTLQRLLGGYRFWCLLLYSISILLITSIIASRKHLWWDEIGAFYVATSPSIGAMWRALSSGIDWQTPTYYLPLHYLCMWFGPSEIVMRLIAIVPYWLATLVLYFTVARRTAPVYGFIAMLFPSVTGAFNYAFEARPYGLVPPHGATGVIHQPGRGGMCSLQRLSGSGPVVDRRGRPLALPTQAGCPGDRRNLLRRHSGNGSAAAHIDDRPFQ
jgi:hypothetical protein